MLLPRDTAPSRWRWLDCWFEPPWRALLTWLALAACSGWILDHGGMRAIHVMTAGSSREFSHFLSSVAVSILLIWMEPIALRLNMLRGGVWLAVRSAPLAPFIFGEIIPSALAVLILYRWRSRPLMAILGGVLVLVTDFVFSRHYPVAGALWALRTTGPYAIVLLLGTRLLPKSDRGLPSD